MNGACLCGRVTLVLPARPEGIAICNCRLCRATGAAWGYFDPKAVAITGETRTYTREDIDDAWLDIHFCPRCGSTTHYTGKPGKPVDKAGVNMRLFPQNALEEVPVIYQDARQVVTEDDPFVTTGTGWIGDGKAF